jgi:hypothetical protein
MGRYSCPICEEDVPPVSLGPIKDGDIVPEAHGLIVERTRCPECGELIERTPLDSWCRAGRLAYFQELDSAGV